MRKVAKELVFWVVALAALLVWILMFFIGFPCLVIGELTDAACATITKAVVRVGRWSDA